MHFVHLFIPKSCVLDPTKERNLLKIIDRYNICHNDNVYECCSHDKYLVLIFSLNSNPTTETVSSTVDAVLVFSIIYLGLTFLIITLDLPQKSTLRIVYVTRIFLCLLSLEP